MKVDEKGSASESIEIKKSTLWKYSTFALLAVLIVGGIWLITSSNRGPTGNVIAENPGQQPAVVKASIDDDAMIGNKNAKVTIIEFSDYQCPFCRKFWTETYSQIKKDYIDTGKANLVFRDLPLTGLHPSAEIAAEAAECVRQQGGDAAYFEMHDKIFAEQNKLDSGSVNGPVTKTVTFGASDLKSWAKDLGYDIGSCLDKGTFKSEVAKDAADAQAAGGQGTPYFVIGGTPLSGAQPYSVFKQIIDSKL